MSLRLCEQWFFMHLKKITSNIIQIIPEFQLILFNLVSYFILKHQNWLTYNTVRKSVALWIFIMRPFFFLFFLLLFSTSSLKLEAEFKDVFCIIYFLWLWLLVQNIYSTHLGTGGRGSTPPLPKISSKTLKMASKWPQILWLFLFLYDLSEKQKNSFWFFTVILGI